jgi:hypothetical protein
VKEDKAYRPAELAQPMVWLSYILDTSHSLVILGQLESMEPEGATNI